MKEALYFGVGKTAEVNGGFQVTTEEIPAPWDGTELVGTSGHESVHSGLALIPNKDGVKRVTKVPKGSTRGVTMMTSFNAVAAIGPHACGMDGTGYDMALCRHMRVNESAASAVARRQVSKFKENFLSLQYELNQKSTLDGYEAYEAFARPDEGKEVRARIKAPDGTEHVVYDKARDGLLKLSGDLFTFSEDKFPLAA